MNAISPALLVPPVRLGRILHEARCQSGESIDALVSRCGLAYDDWFFADVESGRAPLDEPTVRWLAALYDIHVDQLVPQRSKLVIDLNDGAVAIGESAATLDATAPQDVLAKYLALVYELRGLRMGSPLKIRELDLGVLSNALELRPREVQSRIHTLISGDREPIDSARRRIRNRLVVPMAGILVGVTTVGALLFIRTESNDEPLARDTPTMAPSTMVDIPQVEIDNAVILTR